MPEGCPFCLSSAVSEVLHVREMYKGTRDVFDYAVCGDCASVYITDFPADIARYYEGYYSFEEAPPTQERRLSFAAPYSTLVVRSGLRFLLRPFYRCPFPWQMRLVSPNLQAFLYLCAKADSRILDVGSGGGEFVKMLRRLGYSRSTGIDPFLDEDCADSCVRRSDIHSVTDVYDVIIFNHSFEHLHDPEAVLRKCFTLIPPSGRVVIHIPNIHSPEFRRYKQDWWGLHAPYHCSSVSLRGIESLAARCGFGVADKVGTSRPDHYLYSQDYSRGVPDTAPDSIRRALEAGTVEKGTIRSLAKRAYSLNKTGNSDWIAYYLART